MKRLQRHASYLEIIQAGRAALDTTDPHRYLVRYWRAWHLRYGAEATVRMIDRVALWCVALAYSPDPHGARARLDRALLRRSEDDGVRFFRRLTRAIYVRHLRRRARS